MDHPSEEVINETGQAEPIPVVETQDKGLSEDKENGEPDVKPDLKPDVEQDLKPEDKPVEEQQADEVEDEKVKPEETTTEKTVTVSIGPVSDVHEEVTSSTKNDSCNNAPQRSQTRRRSSYQGGGGGRGYSSNFQNYGLTYLPYKSNFEPSEDARRRADEFLKTLKL